MAGIRIRYPLVNQYSTGVLSQAQGPLERQQILAAYSLQLAQVFAYIAPHETPKVTGRLAASWRLRQTPRAIDVRNRTFYTSFVRYRRPSFAKTRDPESMALAILNHVRPTALARGLQVVSQRRPVVPVAAFPVCNFIVVQPPGFLMDYVIQWDSPVGASEQDVFEIQYQFPGGPWQVFTEEFDLDLGGPNSAGVGATEVVPQLEDGRYTTVAWRVRLRRFDGSLGIWSRVLTVPDVVGLYPEQFPELFVDPTCIAGMLRPPVPPAPGPLGISGLRFDLIDEFHSRLSWEQPVSSDPFVIYDAEYEFIGGVEPPALADFYRSLNLIGINDPMAETLPDFIGFVGLLGDAFFPYPRINEWTLRLDPSWDRESYIDFDHRALFDASRGDPPQSGIESLYFYQLLFRTRWRVRARRNAPGVAPENGEWSEWLEVPQQVFE